MFMADIKGTALVKAKQRYLKLITVFPDREDFYRTKLVEVEAKIVAAQVCRRCGRALKDETAKKLGYGKECLSNAEAESAGAL
jgi:hypothetical protein